MNVNLKPRLTEDIIQRLIEIIETNLDLDIPSNDIRPKALLREELGIDSVAMINFISAIEQRLNFEFEVSDLLPESFTTLESIARVIHRHLLR